MDRKEGYGRGFDLKFPQHVVRVQALHMAFSPYGLLLEVIAILDEYALMKYKCYIKSFIIDKLF